MNGLLFNQEWKEPGNYQRKLLPRLLNKLHSFCSYSLNYIEGYNISNGKGNLRAHAGVYGNDIIIIKMFEMYAKFVEIIHLN